LKLKDLNRVVEKVETELKHETEAKYIGIKDDFLVSNKENCSAFDEE
jgi:hypothetical protein